MARSSEQDAVVRVSYNHREGPDEPSSVPVWLKSTSATYFLLSIGHLNRKGSLTVPV